VRVLREVEGLQDRLTQQIDDLRQVAATPVEAGTFRLMREQVTMLAPAAEQHCLLIPPAALADNRHRDQLGIGTHGDGTRTGERGGQRSTQVADEHIHPGAEVIEIRYHRSHLGWLKGLVR